MYSYRRRMTYNTGRWEIERERTRVATHIPPSVTHDPVSLGAILPGILARVPAGDRACMDTLRAKWQAVAGAALARHTRPGHIEKGLLTVFVDSSAWLNELSRYGQKAMLENIQKLGNADLVRSIRLQLDPGE